jgi:hypothetical protein
MTRRPMSFRTVYWLALILAGLASPLTARAHDVKEMTINARVHPDRVELRIIASNHMGATLLGSADGKDVVLNAETFASLRPALEAQGKRICVLLCDGKPPRTLPVTAIDTLLGQQDEVEFFITYGAPSGPTLVFDATVLDRVQEGCAVTLVVSDAKRNPLGAKALKHDDSRLTVALASAATTAPTK